MRVSPLAWEINALHFVTGAGGLAHLGGKSPTFGTKLCSLRSFSITKDQTSHPWGNSTWAEQPSGGINAVSGLQGQSSGLHSAVNLVWAVQQKNHSLNSPQTIFPIFFLSSCSSPSSA
ncbi:hypothetical protein E2320_006217 [Naja naja]|nr:hypothetical protein E2320_006217 [Naja naja]